MTNFGWLDFEPEPDTTGDGSGDPEKYILTIAEGLGTNYWPEEVAVIVHRVCGGKYPIDGDLANEKRRSAQAIVAALNTTATYAEALTPTPMLIVGALDQETRDEEGGTTGELYLACPWEGCEGTSIYEVDQSIRWNEVHPSLEADGLFVSQGDGNYDTIDWICQTCNRSVTLPEGLETTWS